MRRRCTSLSGVGALVAAVTLGVVGSPSAVLAAGSDGVNATPVAPPQYGLVKLGVLPGDENSVPYGINARGDVVGWSGGQILVPTPFRYTDATGIESVTPGARPAFGEDINQSGDITGSYEHDAFRTVGGTLQDIRSGLEGITTGEDIIPSGQVAITQELNDLNKAWRWSPGVGLEDMGLARTDEMTTAHAINAAGDVVGRGWPLTSDSVIGGYIFRAGSGSVDLNDLLLRRDRHWYISEAWDINDSGHIVAFATNLRNGERQAVRLDLLP